MPGVLVIQGSSGLAAQYKADMISFAEALALLCRRQVEGRCRWPATERAGKRDGTDFHLETCEHQGHVFTGEALTKSRAATVAFFVKTL